MVIFVIYFCFGWVSQGGMIYATARRLVGTNPTLSECITLPARHLVTVFLVSLCLVPVIGVAMIGIVLVSMLSMVLFMLHPVLIILPILLYFLAAVFALTVIFFIPHAILIENRGPIDALVRSWTFVMKDFLRIFLIVLVYVTIDMIINIPLSLMTIFLESFSGNVGMILTALFFGISMVLINIGGTLLYVDQRVRTEGYTGDDLASELE